MTRRLLHLTTFTLAAAAVLPAAAEGARPAPLPVVSKVQPLRLGIGETMTITGKNFRKGANRNTVVLKRDGKKAVFVRAVSATTTRLTVVVPEKLRGSMSTRNGAFVATKFRVRVLTSRFAKRYTTSASSPVILPRGDAPGAGAGAPAAGVASGAAAIASAAPAPAPASAPTPPSDCDGDGIPDSSDADDDADLLPDTLEASLRTDQCNSDSDGDGMEDGWEFQSATDLNRASCPAVEYPTPCAPATPHPAKRSYTNPLFADAHIDYDGDWLSAAHEHAAWKRKGDRTLNDMWYSDGLQASRDSDPSDGCRGVAASTVTPLMGQAAYSLDRVVVDGCLADNERDEDNDFLTNDEEVGGELSSPSFWTTLYAEVPFRVEHSGTDWLDQDTDGDTVVDGMDDQDHDDFWNVEELRRGPRVFTDKEVATNVRTGLWVDPFNPCLPSVRSRTCPQNVPLSGGVWAPFTPHTAEKPIKPRWPLYGEALYTSSATPELWSGLPEASQTMPPAHPLLPRP